MKTKVSRPRLVSISASFVLVASAVAVSPVPAAAQDSGFSQQLDDVRNAVGLGRQRGPIDFTERPPLVVPPTNTLPPPSQDTTSVGVNDPDVESRQRALTDPRRPVPPFDPGASAQGLSSRTYLVDPPSGMRDPAAVAAEPTTDVPEGEHKAVHRRKVRKPAVQASQ